MRNGPFSVILPVTYTVYPRPAAVVYQITIDAVVRPNCVARFSGLASAILLLTGQQRFPLAQGRNVTPLKDVIEGCRRSSLKRTRVTILLIAGRFKILCPEFAVIRVPSTVIRVSSHVSRWRQTVSCLAFA